MKAKVTKFLLALMLVGVLLIPPGIIGAPENEANEQVDDDPLGNMVSTSDNIKIERADPFEISKALSQVEFGGRDLSKARVVNTERALGSLGVDSLMSTYDAELAKPSIIAMETRASDDEQNQNHWDMYNGSVIESTPETISGTLDSKAVSTNSDGIDWFKIEVSNVDPRVPGSVANFTMTLDSYTLSSGSQDSLYELRFVDDDQGGLEPESDYADYMEMIVIHNDYWVGRSYKGGYEFTYDDLDDTDSWTHDENWSFNWRADLKSEGVEDNNGLGNGLTELNWYYIGVGWNYVRFNDAPLKQPFGIDYQFTISSPEMQSDNIYPNDWKNGTDLGLHKDSYLSTLKDQDDWFEVQGTDYDKIWKVDFWWNRTFPLSLDTVNPWSYTPMIAYIDVWVSFYLIWTHWGDDETWGTPDDGYYGGVMTYSLYLDGGGFVSRDDNNDQITGSDGWLINNMTGGTSDSRKMYMGVVLEATNLAFNANGQFIGLYSSPFGATQGYSIDISMAQVPLNNPPQITNITAVSSNPEHERGGNYDDDFDIIVTYTDEDNNEPNELWVEVDPGHGNTPINISAISYAVDKFDYDYTDGKEYKVTFTGRELGSDPEFHIVTAKAKDKLPNGAIQTARWSPSLEAANLIRVWNDEPPELNTNFAGFDSIDEDSPTISQPLDSYVDGMFRDQEGFTGFYIWNTSLGDEGDWDVTFDTDLLHIEIVEEYTQWWAKITPKHNQHGQETLRFKGYDDYMSVEGVWPISVIEVNDPPMVLSIDIDGTIFPVDNTIPDRPVARLEGETVLEDSKFTFQIIAEDQDLEGEKQDLEYSFVRALSDGWDADIAVTWDTGEVSFTPTNNDVRAGNSKMTFGISDNRDEGEIKLEVRFEITNVNDPPEISIPTITQRTYTQFREVRIKPVATDDDPDDTKTFSVNMLSAIGTDVDTIEDQLPFAELREEVDWGINSATGEFWFKVDDQNIWKTSTGMEGQVEITLVFEVKDSKGLTAAADIVLILTDENEEPDKPVEIFYEIEDEDDVTAGIQSLTVNFWVDTVSDPDEDNLRYRWDFGDGQTGEGINVNHTYSKEGPKNVQMWVEDDEYQTDRIAQQIDLEKPVEENGGGGGGGTTTPTTTTEEDDNTMIIIIGIIAVVLILALIVGAFVILRKKPAPEGYYDPNMYGAQGLPPAHSGELPPASTQGGLPPAGQSPQGLPPAQTQTSAAPASSPADKAPQGPAGSSCGNCGSPVDPSWFLCPNCKSPLQ